MLDWIQGADAFFRSERKIRFLDPGTGEGIFFREYFRRFPEVPTEFHGWEIDPILFEESQKSLHAEGIPDQDLFLYREDFLEVEPRSKYDIILCNPPYLRISRSKLGKEIVQRFESEIDAEIPGTANLYVFFLLRILKSLEKGGRASVLLPFEFLNAGYGVPIKKALLESNCLRRILLLNSSWSFFKGAVTSSCILFLENSPAEEGFQWARVSPKSLEEGNLESEKIKWMFANPGAEEKWTFQFRNREAKPEEIKNSAQKSTNSNYVIMSKKVRHGWVPIKEFGSFRRGIATGDNGYFLLSEKDATNLSIPEAYLRSSIPKAQYALSPFFTNEDWSVLKTGGAKVWLLDVKEFPESPEQSPIRKYLQEGVNRGVPERFLPSRRRPWHSQENRGPCTILATSFHREEVRFVFNESSAVHLTCFHGFSSKPEYSDLEEFLFAFLITPQVRKQLESRTREYAQGLRKVEPGDLNSLSVPDLRKLKEEEKEKIGRLLHNYRNSIRPWIPGRRPKRETGPRNTDAESALKAIEKEFLIED